MWVVWWSREETLPSCGVWVGLFMLSAVHPKFRKKNEVTRSTHHPRRNKYPAM